MDVKDEYAERAYADFYPYDLDKHGKETEGRLNEPHGVGFPLLITPAYAIGGADGRGAVPGADRRAGGGAGLPARAAGGARPVGAGRRAGGGAVAPVRGLRHRDLPGADRRGALLAGAALLAARLEESVSRRGAFACFALLGAAALAGHEVRARRDRDRGVRDPLADARAARHAGAGLGRAGAVQRGAVRGDQRGGSTAGPPPTRPTWPARPPPTPASRSATSSAPTAWPRCSSTATTACCAGRPCSCWPSAGCGCSTASGANASPTPCPSCGRWSAPR